MAATKFTATSPAGTAATRSSKTMTYTHAVAANWSDGTEGIVSWHTSGPLAVKAADALRARSASSSRPSSTFHVVTATKES